VGTVLLALRTCVWAVGGYVVVTQKNFTPGTIEVINAETGDRITIDDYGMGPCFSPDGRRIAYSKNDKIYIANSDGSGSATIMDVSCNTGREPMLTWITLDGVDYLYWSTQSEQIYRARVGSSDREVVHTSPDKLYSVSVSADGFKAACSKAAWSVWAIDIGGDERKVGGGCQGTVSPNGQYVTRNLSGHTEADIHDHASGSVVKTITCPTGEFNMHRFSHHSDDWVVFTVDGDEAYLCDWRNDRSYALGGGAPFDYYPGDISTTSPRLSLSATELSFTGELGQSASNPSEARITATNGGAGTMDRVSISGAPSWLSVTIDDSDPNAQVLTNTVDATSLTTEQTYTADITATAANADPSTARYTVEFIVAAQPVFTSIVIDPPSATVQPGGGVVFTAEALDQHGNAMTSQPTFSWSVDGGGTMDGATFTAGQDKGGPYTVTASATIDGVANEATAAVTIADYHLKVNCGNNTYDVAGWERDDAYITEGGSDYTWGGTIDVTGVTNAAPPDVYKSVLHTDHTYLFGGVPNGSYTLRLHLSDHFENRTMTYIAEGVTILENFDIVTEAGGTDKALVKDLQVTVSDGNGLELQCLGNGNDVFEGGIEIIGATATDPLVVQYPNGGETLGVGETVTITWAGDCNELVGVELHLSVDGGMNWLPINTDGDVNCGTEMWESYTWTILEQIDGTSLVSEQCYLRIKEYNGPAEAYSAGAFTIESSGATLLKPAETAPGKGPSVRGLRDGRLSVTVPGRNRWRVTVIDARGAKRVGAVSAGSDNVEFGRLPAGMYVVRIVGRDGMDHRRRIIVTP
jgi:hypothetical protein